MPAIGSGYGEFHGFPRRPLGFQQRRKIKKIHANNLVVTQF